MVAAKSQKSFFEQLTSQSLNAIWPIRIMTAVALLTSGTAMWIVKTGEWHSFLEGATFGILIGVFAQACIIRSSEPATPQQPSDVEDLRVTPV